MGRRALNASVEFLDVFRVTQNVGSRVNYTLNIFIHFWGVNPTDTVSANVYIITRRAYDHIWSFHGFVLRSNHERLRLKRIELKHIRFEKLLARTRQDVRDDVVANVCSPANHALDDFLYNDSDSDDGWLNTSN